MNDNKRCSKLLDLVKVLGKGKSTLLSLEVIEISFSAKVVICSLMSTENFLEKNVRKNV